MISEHFFHFLIYETCGSFGVNFINRFTKHLSIRSKIMTHYKTGLKHAFTTFYDFLAEKSNRQITVVFGSYF